MEYKAPIDSYSGVVREVVLGKEGSTLKLGGENILPLHFFDEGSLPNSPKFALEMWDTDPTEWAESVREPYKDVLTDPVKWAQKCVEYGADAVFLRLESTDPLGKDGTAAEAAAVAKKVLDAISIPLIVCGTADETKDVEVLTKVAEACAGTPILMGPALKENYEAIGKAALDHGHSLIAQSPLDINLLKELNIKLSKTFPMERIVVDPMVSSLGYGMEYGFTITERVKQIGIIHKDGMTQMPILADLGEECWKTKEAKASKDQGLMWEGVTALSMLLAGANLLIVRHPETLKLVKETLKVS